MDIYAAACCLFPPPFPLEVPSIAALREAIVCFMSPGGTESIQGQGCDSGILIWAQLNFSLVVNSAV